ncbi:MAG: ribosome maturation factor RimP [Pseudomonadota bacterium]
MSLEGTPLWSTIEEIAREEGVALFDIDLPSDTRRGGALRVFITKHAVSGEPQAAPVDGVAVAADSAADSAADVVGGQIERGGISFEDCVRVSKRILDLDEQQEIIPGNCTLEVSSPGINRKLRLPDHFSGAVGERVKVKFRSGEAGSTVVVNGVIREASLESIRLQPEGKEESVQIPLDQIKEARVDFKFTNS